MKNLTIWQRLNLAHLLLIVLLLAGGLTAWWIKSARAEGALKSERATLASARLQTSLLQLSLGLRGELLDPTNPNEKERVNSFESNFTTALEQCRALTGSNEECSKALDAIQDFVDHELMRHKTTISDMAGKDPPAAMTYYAQTYASLQNRQKELLGEFNSKLTLLLRAWSEHADKAGTTGLTVLGIILLLSVLISLLASSSVNKPIVELIEHLDRLRQGDYSRRLPANRSDEFGTIGEGMNRVADDLANLVGQVQRSGIKVNTTATEIAASAREQQSTANEIAATTAEIGATSKEISSTSQELVKTISEVSDVAGETAGLAGTGQGAITRMEETMRQIMNASKAITSKLSILNEKTGNINSVVTTINKVADQTNLLSLNAAIEAEKAGEYGLGFAVVAIEIRRLADQTAVATYDIERMVKEMQSAVSAGVMGMDRFSEDVRRGVEEIRQVGLHLAEIITQVQALTPRFQTVHEGMQSQASGAQQICETLIQLSEAAQQTAESLQQSNQVIVNLNEAARGLQSSVSRFRLNNGNPA